MRQSIIQSIYSLPPGSLAQPSNAHTSSTSTWALRRIVLIFIVTRVVLTLVGLMAMALWLPPHRSDQTPLVSHWKLLDLWSHFDGTWYLQIARNGYHVPAGGIPNVVFSPLLPGLMAAGGCILGHGETGLLMSGLIVSNLALLVAMTYLHRLVRLDFDTAVADRAVLFAMVFPTTLFLSALYPMSLILAIGTTAMYYGRRGNFAAAACIAALAPLTRPDGLLLVGPLFIEWLQQRFGANSLSAEHRPATRDLLWLLLIPAAMGGWLAYLHVCFGDALLFVHAQPFWATWGWPQVIAGFPQTLGSWGVTGMTVMLLGLLMVACHRLCASYIVYFAMFLLLSLFCGRLASMPRFALVLFPAFISLALLGCRPRVHRVLMCLGSALAVLMMIKFAVFSFAG